jgi:PAS domain S-box-containing protein
MAIPIRILVLDDAAADAELEIAALEEGGYTCDWWRVDTRSDYTAALDKGGFDVVISDYTLPSFDGLAALRLFLERGLELPFVLVSGNIGEEVAIESLKAGATDYVLKSRLERLAPVVTRALHEKQELRRRKLAEEALRESERDLRSLIQNAPYGIYRADRAGKFLDVNPALVKMLGYNSESELLAIYPQTDLFKDPAQVAVLVARGEKESFENLELEWKRRDGSTILVRLSGRPVRDPSGKILSFEVMAENITERRALEEQLRHAQKMEAVGRLAGGVAHDFNNLLMVINGYAELLRDSLHSEDDLLQAESILSAGKKATMLTSQLLAFSRKQVMSPRVLDLNQILTESGKMLPRLIGEDVELQVRLADKLGPVKVDPGQMEQVIMNLVVNARDAMPDGGEVTIETSDVELTPESARRAGAPGPGRYVRLSVSDTGMGMDAQTQSRIFEPFFTTKEKGKGTGLGLATVYGIVQQTGGAIQVTSEPGKGTRFDVHLPRAAGSTDEITGRVPVQPTRGTETVLLVEDEDGVRSLVRQVLSSKGYTVLEAPGSPEAIDICRSYQGKIHLLVTDVVLPHMNGRMLAENLLTLRPAMKVLFVSGYTDDKMIQHGVQGSGSMFLQKPFSADVLAATVRAMLDGTPQTTLSAG